MTNLIGAELLKMRTTRALAWTAASLTAVVGLIVVAAILTAGEDLDTAAGVRSVFAAASAGNIVVVLLGIVVMTAEIRHHTITQTLLATPVRQQLMAAKLAATGLVGAVLAGAATVLTLGIAVPWLAAKGAHVTLLSGDVAGILTGAAVATVLYGLVGVGVGALIRSQVAALILTLVWMLTVENLLLSLAPQVGRWLPGGATAALTREATYGHGLLPPWGGGLLLAAYAVGFSLLGARSLRRTDIAA